MREQSYRKLSTEELELLSKHEIEISENEAFHVAVSGLGIVMKLYFSGAVSQIPEATAVLTDYVAAGKKSEI
ncbi:MAG TPA: hypothetical protein VLH19_05575 [Patescibacteria group bacterium]|nr:hypothetical protein [Patescibacteria group bacterium]